MDNGPEARAFGPFLLLGIRFQDEMNHDYVVSDVENIDLKMEKVAGARRFFRSIFLTLNSHL